jgi:hypothetical protein
MKDFLGDAGGIPSARMSKVLEMARKAVINDGVSENHESFADLQILMAAHLLDSTGAIGGSVQPFCRVSVISRGVPERV